jgi:chromosome segregation ATPase
MSEIDKDSIIKSFADNLIRIGNDCRDYALEVKRLKAELADLKSTADQFQNENSILIKEINRLLVEVDSLMTSPTSRLLRAEREENARLKAEVERLKAEPERLAFLLNNAYLEKERLRKAGDKLDGIASITPGSGVYSIRIEWMNAKEGKQS